MHYHKIEIYIPSVDRYGNSILESSFRKAKIESISILLSQCFTGCTEIEGIGHWINDGNKYITEPCTIVYSYFSENKEDRYLHDQLENIRIVCQKMAYSMSQESIFLVIDNKPECCKPWIF